MAPNRKNLADILQSIPDLKDKVKPEYLPLTHPNEQNRHVRAGQSKPPAEKYKVPEYDTTNVDVKYFIEYSREIGRGTGTIVHKCIERRNGKQYAIKTIPKKLNRTVDVETTILSEMNHPNIIGFNNVLEDEKAVYVVTELCDGGDLFSAVVSNSEKKHKNFSDREAARIIQQLLEGVDHIHSKDVCHRDLKLENILLIKKNKLDIKIIDFDLATKHYISDEPLSNPAGTAHYMAPEVVQRTYSKSCDIWSIGVIAYALLSGTLPFVGKNNKDTFDMIKNMELQFPPKAWAGVSETAKDFIANCLEKNQFKRLSAKALLQHDW
eukprot:CAMPEP_0178899678 /NCGR_PEP_ID=MMETSP0786-20121207/3040_1 /TAXON_ID=186022 /ORGANISM="Thalassionema frauenfeldii, Strain CCMP 1798" /LENGTH=322 /DNA_ID=CAMNT_0020570575 /DNA_START=108 /DNA_END=1073 /DNA_ORIENTATION=+